MSVQATNPDRALLRVRRMAKAVPNGQGVPILEFLQDHRSELVAAAQRGITPLTEISAKLLQRFGAETMNARVTKQFCGLAVSAMLAEEGFIVSKTAVRVRNDPIFSAGTVYTKRPVVSAGTGSSVLQRLLDSLTEEELQWTLHYVRQKLRQDI
jgi:hypothetical protein